MNKILLGGFLGGATVSLLELLAAINAQEFGMVSLFFFVGMAASGIIGIIGVLIMSPVDIKHAVTTGIAAPSILAGLVKSSVAPTVITALLYSVSPPAYAGSTDVDGTSIEIEVDSTEVVQDTTEKQKPKKSDQFLRGVFGL